MKIFSPLLALCFAARLFAADSFDQSGVALEVDSTDAKLAKIVLLAGTPSSKSGAHEYFAGCALLLQWLKEQPGVWPVMAREWPKNEKILEGAKAIVYFGDGGGKQPFVNPERWAKLTKMIDGGAGFVLLHQAVDFPKGPDAEKVMDWVGGVFHGDIGCRGHWDMDLKPTGEHPVVRGVKPFAAPGDGWLYNLHFGSATKPLLVGQVPEKSRSSVDAKKHAGRDEVIAWASERPSGGRGFGFTGADLHKSWGYQSQRKLVVNAILWTAKLDVPEGGAKTTFIEADLSKNLDKKTAPPAKATPKTAPKPSVK